MTVDQPLYALAKTIQWSKPNCLGEDKFLVMLGDLHIEMTLMKCVGMSVKVTITCVVYVLPSSV